MHFVSQVHDMEFAPSLDIVINETLPALQKVHQIESQNLRKNLVLLYSKVRRIHICVDFLSDFASDLTC